MRIVQLFFMIKLLSFSAAAADVEQDARFNEYYLQILNSIATAGGFSGIALGTLMAAGSGCLYDSALLDEGLCVAGIGIASLSGFLFVAGNAAVGFGFFYNLINHNRERQLQEY